MYELPFRRIAVTVPPDHWFHGIAKALFEIYRQGLVELGLAVFDVPVEPFIAVDPIRIGFLAEELRGFRPDLAFGLPKGSYALLCRLPPRRDGSRPNLFTEILDIPTICFWDHAPVELADQMLTPLPAEPDLSMPGAIEALRRVLTHPRLVHWSRDSGQTRIMTDLGLLRPQRIIHEMPPSLPGFLPQDTSGRLHDDVQPRVAFVGHVYQEERGYPHPELDALVDDVLTFWTAACSNPLWDVLADRLAALPGELRRRLALHPDQTYFWHFAHRLMLCHAQTLLRLKMLGAASIAVACYGNVRTDLPGVPGNLRPVAGHIPFGPALARTLARHPITIDVLNPGSIHGYSHKPGLGFAAGGFVLVNRKQHFIDAFGDAGEAVSYDSAEDLAAKVDCYLGDPRYRREVGDAIRERIAARFQLRHVLARVLHRASESADPAASSPASAIAFETGGTATTLKNLLPSLRSESHWDASVTPADMGALISTPPQAWAYAALIDLPSNVSAMCEPHLRISIIVEAGRIGIAVACDDTGTLIAEQTVGTTASPVTVIVELPRERSSRVILRNVADATSRARVLEASLCDRAG